MSGLEHHHGIRGVEQEGGTGGWAGSEASTDVQPSGSSGGQIRQSRALTPGQNTGILLWQYELHEVISEDCCHAVQK